MLFKVSSAGGKIKKRKISGTVRSHSFSGREKRKKMISKGFLKKAGFFLLLLAFLGVVTYALFFSAFVEISKIEIDGTTSINPDLIRQDIEAQLSGKYFNLIEKNNILFVNDKTLQSTLLNKYEKIENIQVKKVFPNGIKIIINERVPAMILCSNEECFVVDTIGFTYMRYDSNANDVQLDGLMRLTDNGNKSIKFRDNFLTKEFVGYVVDIRKGVKDDLGIDLSPDCQTPQLVSGDIRVQTADGWWIYFDNSRPVQKELEMLKAVLLEKIDKDGQRGNLEYVDLRIDNKVYYKLKNQDGVVENPEIVPAPVAEVKTADDKSSKKKK